MLRPSTDLRPYPWRLWDESSLSASLLCAGYLAVTLALLHRWDHATTRHPFVLILALWFGILTLDRFFGLLARGMKQVRSHARMSGWYWPWRRPIQVGGMLILLALGIVTLDALGARLATVSETMILAGTLYSTLLVGLRAISFHEFDMILYRRRRWLGGRTLNAPIEWAGLLVTLAATLAG